MASHGRGMSGSGVSQTVVAPRAVGNEFDVDTWTEVAYAPKQGDHHVMMTASGMMMIGGALAKE